MATKPENIKTIQALAVKLGREPDITGSAADLAQRVAEWQDELNELEDGSAGIDTAGTGSEGTAGDDNAGTGSEGTAGDDNGAGGEITQDKPTTTETKPTTAEPKPAEKDDENRLVLVAMLTTAHLAGAFDATGKKKVTIASRGDRVHVPQKYVASLRRSKFIA